MAGGKTARKKSMAARVDLHAIYEDAVQNVEEQCRFIDMSFTMIRGRRPVTFREDFCGTASAACEFVRGGRSRRAWGVDIDRQVLAWGRRHRVSALTRAQRKRVSLLHGDVLVVDTPPVDVIGAFNFSYWIFRKRALLLSYFQSVYRRLDDNGVFFLDAYGGYDAFRRLEEEMEMDGFTYAWEQADYNPLSGHMTTHIHFRFPDGSEIRRAFSYKWRLWTLPEICELLKEAGFARVTVHQEYTDADGEGLGLWRAVKRLQPVSAFVVNITAEK